MDIPKILDTLIDGWCERRAIRPLKYLLRAYPGPLAHTDQLYEFLDALKDVKDLYATISPLKSAKCLIKRTTHWKILLAPGDLTGRRSQLSILSQPLKINAP